MSSHLLDDDSELLPRRDREVTLSTGAILALFFGLVLLCGLFFALGYNMHKSAPPLAATGDAPTETSSNSPSFSHFKPSAGSAPAAAAPSAGTPVAAPPASAHPAPKPEASTPAEAPASSPAPIVRPAPATIPHSGAEPPPAPTGPNVFGSFLVQVAAVSHQEDANLLIGALKTKGYAVSARSEPQDKLFHIQIGPFNNKRDAEATRQRLLTDGYNAIVK